MSFLNVYLVDVVYVKKKIRTMIINLFLLLTYYFTNFKFLEYYLNKYNFLIFSDAYLKLMFRRYWKGKNQDLLKSKYKYLFIALLPILTILEWYEYCHRFALVQWENRYLRWWIFFLAWGNNPLVGVAMTPCNAKNVIFLKSKVVI